MKLKDYAETIPAACDFSKWTPMMHWYGITELMVVSYRDGVGYRKGHETGTPLYQRC